MQDKETLYVDNPHDLKRILDAVKDDMVYLNGKIIKLQIMMVINVLGLLILIVALR